MEELVKMFVDEGAIRTGDAGWSLVPDKLVAVHVPATLTGVLQARLDSLKPFEKLALQQASVIGFEFWDQALAAIDPDAVAALQGLLQREFVVAHAESRLDGAREYAFKHQLLHHVTYDSLLRTARRDGHAKAAGWLAGLSGVRADDFLGATALHFEKGGNPALACDTFARAAEHARDRYAHEAALDHVGRALALIDAGAPGIADDRVNSERRPMLRWRLIDARERTLDLLGDRSAQQADIAVLEQLAEDLDDDHRRGEAAWRRSDFSMRTGDYRSQERSARQALLLAQRVGDEPLALRAKLRLAIAVSLLGDPVHGKSLGLEGLAAARELGLRSIESLFLNALSVIAGIQDDTMMSLEMDQQRLLVDRELGNPRNEAISLGNLGSEWLSLGEFAKSRVHLEEGLRLTRSVGDRGGEATPTRQFVPARSAARRRHTCYVAGPTRRRDGTSRAQPDRRGLCTVPLRYAELALGRMTHATAAFKRARAVASAIDDGQRFDASAGLALSALAEDDLESAMEAVDALLAHLASVHSFEGAEQSRRILLTCYRVLQRTNDPRAAEVLKMAHGELQAKAATINNPELRHSYLTNLVEHREIVMAWGAHQASSAGLE
jgi:tetratricopeptide (TPR) repeat protein